MIFPKTMRNGLSRPSPDDFRPDEHKQIGVVMHLDTYSTCEDCAALVRLRRRDLPPAIYCRLGYPMHRLVPAGICPHPKNSREVDLARKLYRRHAR